MGRGSDAYQTNAAFWLFFGTYNEQIYYDLLQYNTILQNSVAVRCDSLTIWHTKYMGVSEMGIPI